MSWRAMGLGQAIGSVVCFAAPISVTLTVHSPWVSPPIKRGAHVTSMAWLSVSEGQRTWVFGGSHRARWLAVVKLAPQRGWALDWAKKDGQYWERPRWWGWGWGVSPGRENSRSNSREAGGYWPPRGTARALLQCLLKSNLLTRSLQVGQGQREVIKRRCCSLTELWTCLLLEPKPWFPSLCLTGRVRTWEIK